jgi:hypothetical protein
MENEMSPASGDISIHVVFDPETSMHRDADDLRNCIRLDLVDSGWLGEEFRELNPLFPHQYAMTSLYQSIIKKFHNDETDAERDDKALTIFLAENSRCGQWSVAIHDLPSLHQVVLGEFHSALDNFLHPQGLPLLSLSTISRGFALGSGANIGAPGTDFYSKLAISKLSMTSSTLHKLYVHAIEYHPGWSGLESTRHLTMGESIVEGNRLSFVPKTAEISRTICTEPTLNMLFQKGIAAALERRLREVFSIDLSFQPEFNAHLARVGSLTGRFGTIDLSSASDSISMRMVSHFFPRDFLLWTDLCRSPRTVLPDGSIIDLQMVSSMGNAFTFPLQTAIFACLVRAVYKALGLKFHRPSKNLLRPSANFAVFGDDIIVDWRAYDLLVEMLDIIGFRVNPNKSFNTGLFRESCGSDYLSGHNVRGVYVKTLRDDMDYYSAINRLNHWSARHMVPLPRSIKFLLSKVDFRPIPMHEGDDAGIKVPLALSGLYYNRFGLITYKVKTLVARSVSVPDDWDELTEVEQRRGILLARRHVPDWFYNQDGLMMSFLAGSLRTGLIGLRSVDRKPSVKKRRTLCWEYYPSAPFERKGFCDDWKFITRWNLGL